MNKYTELSDFEINKKVAEKAGIKYTTGIDKVYEMFFFSPDSQPIPHEFDPCNKPYDAWKVMIKYNICVVKNMYENYYDAYIDLNVTEYYTEYKYHQSHENPLRACMEVFLMIKDFTENEND